MYVCEVEPDRPEGGIPKDIYWADEQGACGEAPCMKRISCKVRKE